MWWFAVCGFVRDVLCLVLVCLPVCGLLRRNGARPREMADLRVLATTRRIHIRRRVAVLRDSSHFRGFRPASGGEASRAVHPRELGQGDACSSLASGKSSTPPARCIHRPQRDTSSAEYRLLVSLASVGASRELSSRRSPALAPYTCAVCPTFRYGAFLFVAFALPDLSSARLAIYGNRSNRRFTTVPWGRSPTISTPLAFEPMSCAPQECLHRKLTFPRKGNISLR